MLIWGCVMLDVLDGAVARAGGTASKFGAVLDSTCDRIVDASVFACIGWYFARHNQPWMLAGCLLCLILGSLTSYIRARAEGVGSTPRWGSPSGPSGSSIILVGTGLSGQQPAGALRAGDRGVAARRRLDDHRGSAARYRVAAVQGRKADAGRVSQ